MKIETVEEKSRGEIHLRRKNFKGRMNKEQILIMELGECKLKVWKKNLGEKFFSEEENLNKECEELILILGLVRMKMKLCNIILLFNHLFRVSSVETPLDKVNAKLFENTLKYFNT